MSQLESILSLPQVRVRDPHSLAKKLSTFIQGGAEQLMVISDFDFTLSRFSDEQGNRCASCYCVFDDALPEQDPQFKEKFNALYKKFGPIEHDHSLTIEQKVPFMEEWWTRSHECILNAGFKRDQIEKYVVDSKIRLRDNAERMMEKMTSHNVPFIIFSAGIGTIIDMYLRNLMGKIADNTHIVSNMISFDGQGVVSGFSEPLIHVFCKNSSVIPDNASFSGQLHGRKNVILLGDSVGDASMDVGVEEEQASLKIGFVNHDTDKLVDKYLHYFDIVLVEDQSMDVPNSILEAIFATNA